MAFNRRARTPTIKTSFIFLSPVRFKCHLTKRCSLSRIHCHTGGGGGRTMIAACMKAPFTSAIRRRLEHSRQHCLTCLSQAFLPGVSHCMRKWPPRASSDSSIVDLVAAGAVRCIFRRGWLLFESKRSLFEERCQRNAINISLCSLLRRCDICAHFLRSFPFRRPHLLHSQQQQSRFSSHRLCDECPPTARTASDNIYVSHLFESHSLRWAIFNFPIDLSW